MIRFDADWLTEMARLSAEDEHTPLRSGLRGVDLMPEFRSDANDVVRDFYEPCLRACQLYSRAIGYFTSAGLSKAALGIEALANSEGRMRLIASPLLEPNGESEIWPKAGAHDELVTYSLLRELSGVNGAAAQDRLALLAWLVAEERLDMRLIVPVSADGSLRPGIRHERLGIFADAAGNEVVFTSSADETAGSIDIIDVFWSWHDPFGRVDRKRERLDRLWEGSINGLRVMEFPHAARQKLLSFRRERKTPSQPAPAPISQHKWRHQDEAVAWFLEHEHGILEMATGTGKTRTALRIAEELWRTRKIDSAIIAADGNDLLDQWYAEVLRLRERLPGKVSFLRDYGNHRGREYFELNPQNKILLASRGNLSPSLRAVKAPQAARTLLLHDEVHRLGSPANRAALVGLADGFRFRLGLSATPEREYDVIGTSFITTHVSSNTFRFDLGDAIRRGILAPFHYHAIEYSPDENDKNRLRQVYQMAAARKAAGNPMSQEDIWIELSRVHKTSQAKLAPFEEFIADRTDLLRRCIIFVETREYGADVLHTVHKYRDDFHTYYADEDAEVLRRFAQGELECLITCHKLSEGIDIRSLETVILFSSARARLETIQRIGRCLRADPSNPTKRANVVDFVRTDSGDVDGSVHPNADSERRVWLEELAQIQPEEST